MQLANNEVHIWVAALTHQEHDFTLLNAEERERASRLHSPLHQQRFIAAHAALRKILAMYLEIAPVSLQFTFSDHHKPALAATHQTDLQFNLSHSGDIAIYAVTRTGQIGIDLEKIQEDPKSDVAARFFSSSEQAALTRLPIAERPAGFFCIWAKKEAIIKANGKGFAQPLSSFSVSLDHQPETITVDAKNWIVLPVTLHPEFTSALAFENPVTAVSIWDFNDQKSKLRSTIDLAC